MRTRSVGRALLSIGMSALLVALLAAPAAAKTYSSERYTWQESGSYECGEGNWIDFDVWGGGTFRIRTGTGPDENAFFAHDNYWWRAVDTRRSDGVALYFGGNGNFVETKATRVEGTIFKFTSVDAGRPFWVKDADGNVLARDRGSIRQVILFDTLGDATPGGEFIEEVSLRFNGPHPGWTFDACDYFG